MPDPTLNFDGAIHVGTATLTLDDLVRVAREGQRVADLDHDVESRVLASATWIAQTVEQISRGRHSGQQPLAYYGINTGFGALAGRTALDRDYLIKMLSRNLIASHSVGVGPYFDEEVVRAVMLIRAHSLARGLSGVRPLIIRALINMLNEGIYPAVPEQGSLGASGDLAPLAHLILVMCGAPSPESDRDVPLDPTDGEVFEPCDTVHQREADTYYHITSHHRTGEQIVWQRRSGADAMARVGGKVELQAKEALALSNGSTFSAAMAALAVHDAQRLLDHAELAVAMVLEGIRGFRDPFYPHVHQARGHRAAELTAAHVLRYVHGSELLDPGDLHTDPQRIPPQDPYSVRCAPQVHGTIADTLDFARRMVEMEISAVTDNPLIFLDLDRDYKTISGGNFHGEPIAMAMDFLGIALTELGNIADRRMFMMTDYYPSKTYADPANQVGPQHGLHSFLIDEPKETDGLNAGLMMLQATSASLVSECKTLAHPDSVDSIPSSANQEDHVSMSLNAARHTREIVKNIEHVIGLELLCATQAIALQRAKRGNETLRLGQGTQAAYDLMRSSGIEMLTQDRVLYPDIRKIIQLMRSGALIEAARQAAPAESPSGSATP